MRKGEIIFISISELGVLLDLEVGFDHYTGIISTDGVQICGLAAKPLPLDKRPVSFDSVEFIPLSGSSYRVNQFPLF